MKARPSPSGAGWAEGLEVVWIPDSGGLRRFLHGLPVRGKEDLVFYVSPSADEAITEGLERRGFRVAAPPEVGPGRRRAFVRAYGRLIAVLGRANPGLLWWITDTASKNRFSSPLPDLIEEFALLRRLFLRHRRIVVVRPPDVLFPVVSTWVRRRGGRVRGRPPLGRETAVRWARVLRKIVALLRDGGRAVRRIRLTRRAGLPRWAGAGTILRSFAYDHSFSEGGAYSDVFFGPLPGVLRERGPVRILVEVLGDFRRALEHMARRREADLLPAEAFLTPGDVLRAVGRILAAPLRVPPGLAFQGAPVADLVRRAVPAFVCDVRLYHALHEAAVRRLAREVAVSEWIQPYENYPWERATIAALRGTRPSCRITGYQHTVVPEAYLNFFVTEEERASAPQPDRVLTTGPEPLRIMEEGGRPSRGFLQAACALRFVGWSGPEGPSDRGVGPVRRILVALEGCPQSVALVRYALRQASGHPEWRVRLRTHPLLPWREYERRFRLRLPADGRVHVSEGTLAEDLSWADALLYWSTTVSLQALLRGRPVVHFARRFLLSYDPLFAAPAYRWTVGPEEDLGRVVAVVDALSPEDHHRLRERAVSYLEGYFRPVSEAALEPFSPRGEGGSSAGRMSRK